MSERKLADLFNGSVTNGGMTSNEMLSAMKLMADALKAKDAAQKQHSYETMTQRLAQLEQARHLMEDDEVPL